jgi:hypothetical protein
VSNESSRRNWFVRTPQSSRPWRWKHGNIWRREVKEIDIEAVRQVRKGGDEVYLYDDGGEAPVELLDDCPELVQRVLELAAPPLQLQQVVAQHTHALSDDVR